jgi:signal transduction histidine kinase
MEKFKYTSLVLVVIGIGLLHFFTPGHLVFYHDTYRRLSYFPIALGGIWYGVWGGVSLALLTSIAFIPHLLIFFGEEPATYLSELTEILLYLAAGAGIGFIAGRESRLRTKYKRLAEKLQKSYRHLHAQTALLVEVEEQLRASHKLTEFGRMAASLAHEIKNPLGAIKGTAEILLDDYPANHPKREFAEILLAETTRLDTSVNEALRLLQGRTPDLPPTLTEPLAQVITRVVKLLDNELQRKDIICSVEGLEAVHDVRVAGEKISQIFFNVILNAVAAVKPSGHITVRIDRKTDGVYVDIQDDGPGIPPAVETRIFEPFFTGRDEGTGLGLSISRKIAESYGGSLRLKASVSGACFEFFLPANGR